MEPFQSAIDKQIKMYGKTFEEFGKGFETIFTTFTEQNKTLVQSAIKEQFDVFVKKFDDQKTINENLEKRLLLLEKQNDEKDEKLNNVWEKVEKLFSEMQTHENRLKSCEEGMVSLTNLLNTVYCHLLKQNSGKKDTEAFQTDGDSAENITSTVGNDLSIDDADYQNNANFVNVDLGIYHSDTCEKASAGNFPSTLENISVSTCDIEKSEVIYTPKINTPLTHHTKDVDEESICCNEKSSEDRDNLAISSQYNVDLGITYHSDRYDKASAGNFSSENISIAACDNDKSEGKSTLEINTPLTHHTKDVDEESICLNDKSSETETSIDCDNLAISSQYNVDLGITYHSDKNEKASTGNLPSTSENVFVTACDIENKEVNSTSEINTPLTHHTKDVDKESICLNKKSNETETLMDCDNLAFSSQYNVDHGVTYHSDTRKKASASIFPLTSENVSVAACDIENSEEYYTSEINTPLTHHAKDADEESICLNKKNSETEASMDHDNLAISSQYNVDIGITYNSDRYEKASAGNFPSTSENASIAACDIENNEGHTSEINIPLIHHTKDTDHESICLNKKNSETEASMDHDNLAFSSQYNVDHGVTYHSDTCKKASASNFPLTSENVSIAACDIENNEDHYTSEINTPLTHHTKDADEESICLNKKSSETEALMDRGVTYHSDTCEKASASNFPLTSENVSVAACDVENREDKYASEINTLLTHHTKDVCEESICLNKKSSETETSMDRENLAIDSTIIDCMKMDKVNNEQEVEISDTETSTDRENLAIDSTIIDCMKMDKVNNEQEVEISDTETSTDRENLAIDSTIIDCMKMDKVNNEQEVEISDTEISKDEENAEIICETQPEFQRNNESVTEDNDITVVFETSKNINHAKLYTLNSVDCNPDFEDYFALKNAGIKQKPYKRMAKSFKQNKSKNSKKKLRCSVNSNTASQASSARNSFGSTSTKNDYTMNWNMNRLQAIDSAKEKQVKSSLDCRGNLQYFLENSSDSSDWQSPSKSPNNRVTPNSSDGNFLSTRKRKNRDDLEIIFKNEEGQKKSKILTARVNKQFNVLFANMQSFSAKRNPNASRHCSIIKSDSQCDLYPITVD